MLFRPTGAAQLALGGQTRAAFPALTSTVNALDELKTDLDELEEFFSSELKEHQFRTLALRLQYRDCKKAEKEAMDEVRKAHNAWPVKYIKERARKMKEEVKLSLMKEESTKDLMDYIDLDYPELYQDACFGQFLFKNRHLLKTEEVQKLVKNLEKIRLLNDYIDPKGTIRRREKEAQGRELTEDEKTIVKGLCGWIAKVEWRGGATVDSITMGLKKALGVGFSLDEEAMLLSDRLWKMLKDRRNCDAEKSLMVTWLNIVGWCVRQRLISGKSPSLCKVFFPRCGQDDYKAIDKGRSDPPSTFVKIEPLLERYLK